MTTNNKVTAGLLLTGLALFTLNVIIYNKQQKMVNDAMKEEETSEELKKLRRKFSQTL